MPFLAQSLAKRRREPAVSQLLQPQPSRGISDKLRVRPLFSAGRPPRGQPSGNDVYQSMFF